LSLLARLSSLFRPEPASAIRVAGLKDSALDIPWLTTSRFLNPNLDTGTEGAGNWLELHDALRDSKALTCLDLRCEIAGSLPWTLEARPNTPQAVMDLVREALEDLNLVEDFEELAKASYFGITPMEVRWSLKRGKLLPVELESFDPFYLNFGPDRVPMVQGRPVELGKLILHRHGSAFRNPWGLGRGRTVPRWVRVKVAVAYATYRDYPRYAHDRLHFTYPDGEPDEEQRRYIDIASKLMDSPGLVTPEGMGVVGLRLDSRFDVGVKLMEAANAEIATAILGNTLTTGEGRHGTQALGAVHQDRQERQEASDVRRIDATMNRTLIPWIVALNFGPEVDPPIFRSEQEVKASLQERLQSVMSLKQEGLSISTSWLRETFGIPEPETPSDELKTPEPVLPPSFPEAPSPKSMSKEHPQEDPQDNPQAEPAKLSASDLDPADAMLAAWGNGFAARFKSLQGLAAQALREASSFEGASESLMSLAKDFPTTAAEYLATSLRAARNVGAVEVGLEAKALLLDVAFELDYRMPPEDALRYLAGKVPLTFDQVEALKDAELRARAFWVAGVEQIGLVQEIQQGLMDALSEGTSFYDFRSTWLPRLQGSGVNETRLKATFDTQVHSAYMGGRMASLQANPLVENLTYVTAGDESVRPAHRILQGVTRPKGDPFWSDHTPPLGFRCRCRIRAAEGERPLTKGNDPRLGQPPEPGFGKGAQSFGDYLQAQARTTPSEWTPMSSDQPGWQWLDATQGSGPLAEVPSPEPSSFSTGLVSDPSGRVVSTFSEAAPVLLAPSEAWLTPVTGPEGQLGLQLSYLRPEGNQALLVRAFSGVVPTPGGLEVIDDPSPYRRGVKLL
jgi:SPP1 gp7 family putative phage head morphogenesis protein